jgi:hypothetical protein
MAVMAKDGSRHHSASRARLHDELAGRKGMSTATPMKKDKSDAGPGGMTHPAPTKTPIEEHVEEHGPAHAMMYHHDQDGDGMHHVSTYHGEAASPYGKAAGGQGGMAKDGMGGGESAEGMEHGHGDHPGIHHSSHKSAKAAHDHMARAMDMHHDSEEEETPDDEESENESGAVGIPGLG